MPSLLQRLATAPFAVFGSISAMTHELGTSNDVLRMPLSLSRRIGFVQLRGGSGASSTAAYVASLIARRRAGMVIGVNASPGEASMLWHAGLSATTEYLPNQHRDRARSAQDARAGLPITTSGLYALDLQKLTDGRGSPRASTWFDCLEPITRFYDIVATDWGARSWKLDLGQVAAASHVVCVVARADRHTVEEAAAIVPALVAAPNQPRVVLALVDVGNTAGRIAPRLQAALGVPVVAVPYDPARAGPRALSSSALRARTRIAYTRLATAIIVQAQSPVDRARTGELSA